MLHLHFRMAFVVELTSHRDILFIFSLITWIRCAFKGSSEHLLKLSNLYFTHWSPHLFDSRPRKQRFVSLPQINVDSCLFIPWKRKWLILWPVMLQLQVWFHSEIFLRVYFSHPSPRCGSLCLNFTFFLPTFSSAYIHPFTQWKVQGLQDK